MALTRTIICSVCGKEKKISYTHSNWGQTVCDSCRRLQDTSTKKKHLDILDTLTLSERVRIIEEWIYNYEPYNSSTKLF